MKTTDKWEVGAKGNIVEPGFRVIAKIEPASDRQEISDLVAAAPELRHALTNLLAAYKTNDVITRELAEATAEQAIKKARGEK